jgi:hypothetical protein
MIRETNNIFGEGDGDRIFCCISHFVFFIVESVLILKIYFSTHLLNNWQTQCLLDGDTTYQQLTRFK